MADAPRSPRARSPPTALHRLLAVLRRLRRGHWRARHLFLPCEAYVAFIHVASDVEPPRAHSVDWAAEEQGKLDPDRSVVEFWPKAGSLWDTFDDSNMDAQLKRTANAVKRYSRVNTWLIAPQAQPKAE